MDNPPLSERLRQPARGGGIQVTARNLLGVTMALELLPEWFPEKWNRRPEFATDIEVSDDDRRWRLVRRQGDVLRLVGLVSGLEDSLAAARLIIDLIGSLPDDLKNSCGPVPATGPVTEPAVSNAHQQDALLLGPPLVTGTPSLPEIENAADLLAASLPVPPELLHGILHQGAKLILAGSSKVGKTWLLLDLAVSVASGASWLGLPTQQGPVLYINLEIDRTFFTGRIRAVVGAKAVAVGIDCLDVMNLRGEAAGSSTLIPKILARIGARKYALVIVDPVYKILGGDENDARHVAAMLNDLERLATATGAAVAFAAHFSRAVKRARRRLTA